jgi:hypothetical protein
MTSAQIKSVRRNRMGVDRFGNPHAANLPYARGDILRSTEDDFQKLQVAWSLIRARGPGRILRGTSLPWTWSAGPGRMRSRAIAAMSCVPTCEMQGWGDSEVG